MNLSPQELNDLLIEMLLRVRPDGDRLDTSRAVIYLEDWKNRMELKELEENLP